MRLLVLAASCIALATCGLHEIAPPPIPRAGTLPVIPRLTVVPPGTTEVVLDTGRDHARVEEVLEFSAGFLPNAVRNGEAAAFHSRPLCTTPCSVALERGRHLLHMVDVRNPHRGGFGTVVVGERPVAFRHTMGTFTKHPHWQALGKAALGIGIPFAVLGGEALAIQMSGVISNSSKSNDSQDNTSDSSSNNGQSSSMALRPTMAAMDKTIRTALRPTMAAAAPSTP